MYVDADNVYFSCNAECQCPVFEKEARMLTTVSIFSTCVRLCGIYSSMGNFLVITYRRKKIHYRPHDNTEHHSNETYIHILSFK